MSTRTLLIAIALAALPAGCSYNPGYFPFYLPGGRIQQEHAKPGGPGYFKNFDPKAFKLEVTPNQQVTAPVGSSIVLVGTVVDKDGQPRRSRRIEWVVEGPGNVIEVDESGIYPGRGYKVDNKYAVSYTNYFTKTITRGNTDAQDDVVIAPGQTFCVLSSAVPGETVVTAYAPEVFNWDNGRVVVRILWGEGRFNFPPPAVVRYGGEHTLTTTVTAAGTDAAPGGYRIRYRVIDGPPAVLVSRAGSGTGASQSGTGGKEAETFTDANGAAAVRLVQQDPKAGKTRVAIEVLKPADNGTGPGTIVARKETVIEWAEPQLHLAVNAPKTAGVNGTFPVTVSLENDGAADSRDAQVKVALSDGATLAGSEPPPIRQDANGGLTFALPPVSGKAKQAVTLQVKPAKLGQVTVNADATTTDGYRATTQATTRIEQGRLQMLVEVPAVALAGEPIPVRIAITNSGAVPAENVTVWPRFDAGLSATSQRNPVELTAGTIAPGHTKTLDLPLTAKATGRYAVRTTATGDANLSASAEPVSVEVRRAELAATATGPTLAYLNHEFDWTVTVSNTADVALANVIVRATIPPEVRAKSASDGGKIGPGSVEWNLPDLQPGARKSFQVTVTAAKLTGRAALTVAVLGDVMNGTRPVGDPVGAKAETVVAIIGTPAIVLELASPPGLVEVGKRATFQVRVKNQGTVAARAIEITTYASPELRAVRGSGATEGRIDPTGKVTFPAVDELLPGATLTCTIEVEAAQAGDARFRAEVKAAHLSKPLQEEQAVRVTPK